MSVKMSLGIGAILLGIVGFGAACSGGEEVPERAPTPVFEPTAAGHALAPAAPPTESGSAGSETTAGPVEVPGSTGADAVSGEKLFELNGCNACHATDSSQLVGPGLQGLLERAITRVDGLSAEQYIEQSIRDPSAYLVDGYSDLMPKTFGDLPDQDIRDLIAYLSSLQ